MAPQKEFEQTLNFTNKPMFYQKLCRFFLFFSLTFSPEFPLCLLCYTLLSPIMATLVTCRWVWSVVRWCTTPCMLSPQLTWLKHNWRKCTYSYSQYNTYNNRVNHHHKPTSANTTIRVSQGHDHWPISILPFCEPSTGVRKVFKDTCRSKEEDSRWSG